MNMSPRLQSIAGVQLESSRGSDAFSETFRGFLPGSPRPVLVRVFAPEVAGVRLLPGRFLREFEQMQALQHPNVVELIDYGIDSGTAYMVTAFAPGTVADAVILHPNMDLRLALRIVWEAAQGIAAGHRLGLMHGHLEPASLYLQRAPDLEHSSLQLDSVQVAGIGLLRALAAHGAVARVISPSAWPYLCPEVARGQTPDPRSDVYALGNILAHLLHGGPLRTPASLNDVSFPRTAPTRYEVRNDHPHAPQSLQLLLDRALNPVPEQRFSDTAAFAAVLNAVLTEVDPHNAEHLDPSRAKMPRLSAIASEGVTSGTPNSLAVAAAEALRMAVLAAPPPDTDAHMDQRVKQTSEVVVVGSRNPVAAVRARSRAAATVLAGLVVATIGGGALYVQRARSETRDTDESFPTPTVESVETAPAEFTPPVEATPVSGIEVDRDEPVGETTGAIASIAWLASSLAVRTTSKGSQAAVQRLDALAPMTPAVASPTPETADAPTCAYCGALYDGYGCDAGGVFNVVLPDCDVEYLSIGWGNGDVTYLGSTSADAMFSHTHPAGTLLMHLDAAPVTSCPGTLHQPWGYEQVRGPRTIL